MIIQATSFRHCLISGRCPWERVDVGGEGEEASNLPEQSRPDSQVCQKGEVETSRESAMSLALALVLPV